MVVRLPVSVVARLDERRGERSRGELIDELLEPKPKTPRGSPSPSLARFAS